MLAILTLYVERDYLQVRTGPYARAAWILGLEFGDLASCVVFLSGMDNVLG